MKIIVRKEENADFEAVKLVNDKAFGRSEEGFLVGKLRINQQFIPELSIVAEGNAKIVGHILFFPILIEKEDKTFASLALAPMSVLPEFQNQGIGGRMIRYGFEKARSLGHKSVLVLGHKDYYPKFGFKPAKLWGITAPFEVPEDVFMAYELINNGLTGVSGVVKYPDEFAGL